MVDPLTWLFDPGRFTAHGFCLAWEPEVLAAHISSDIAIALSYLSVALTLLTFSHRRRDLAFPWVFRMIALVFALCGVIHLSDLLIIWLPLYHLQAVVKVVTGLSSVATAVGLWMLLPTALALPSPAALRAINRKLEAEVAVRRHAEQLAQTAKERAEQANAAKSEFLATMSHELRTPLTAILGFADQLARTMATSLDERQKRYVDIIQRSGGHLLNLITDVLDFSKLEVGRLRLEIAPVQVREVIDTSLAVVGASAAEHNLTLSTELAPEVSVIDADGQRLCQVLINLLSNAIKFTPPGGAITIGARFDVAEDRALLLSVSDTGIGMTAEDIPVALEKFRQIDNSLTRRYDGTGLGLPLSKALVELHGGRLAIDSAPDRGTTVTIRLPATRVRDLPEPGQGIWAPAPAKT